ncbi:RagB/SusD family nutrient uptake outer membrane protein [Gabonibacter massiliensis]|uniref:RagB/SusD family nutrient uptake outer membrane protein n=1 Tax=Gabonibacter massiliensis TaxID=1720195 RepID=UPI0009EBA6C0|nr:RagB/SusD family nutrient uptake outer membrane protein [Gabonibacter massiliensis]
MLNRWCVLGICLAFMSCNSWLTIEPKEQISEEDLFSRVEGFYTQLDGLYKSMAEQGMYGQELSWGFLDILAQYYDTENTKNHAYEEASKYNYEYTRVKTIIKTFWTEGYNIIANCNVLIKNILIADPNLFSLQERERDLILGEAYAVRALVHFDLLRLFAPSIKVDGEIKALPYVTEFPVYFPDKVKSSVFLDSVISDLKKAHELVQEYDWSKLERVKELKARLELTSFESNRFLEFRGYRLNYWAVKCLLARVYMYKGDEKSAFAYAKELIDLHEQEDWIEFTTRDDVESQSNLKYYDDVFFALYNNNLTDYSTGYFEENNYICMQDVDGLFSNSDKKYDYRYEAWEDHPLYGSDQPLPKRLKELTQGKGKYCSKMIPMIRLSEMYYIAAEAVFDEDPELAEDYVYFVVRKRGSRAGVAGYNTKEEFIKNIILKDLRREVYGEGQLFFFYKRHHMPVVIDAWTEKTLEKEFVLPSPEIDEMNN